MKKSKLIELLTMMLVMTSCGQESDKIQETDSLKSFTAMSLGQYLRWDSVDEAQEYEIFLDDKSIGTTTKNLFLFDDIKKME